MDSWTDQKTNEEVMEMNGEEGLLQTQEMDQTHIYRRLAAKNSHRRKNGRMENKMKAKTSYAGLNGDRCIWKAGVRGPTAGKW